MSQLPIALRSGSRVVKVTLPGGKVRYIDKFKENEDYTDSANVDQHPNDFESVRTGTYSVGPFAKRETSEDR